VTDTVVSIHLSARYSAMYNAARLGAEAAKDSVHVVPVDSGQISLGMGLIAIAAAEAARRGASLTEVLRIIDDLRRRTHVLAIVNTLEHLRRSGRASQIVALLGDLLRIKPILHVYAGEILLLERVRSWGRAQERLIQIVRAKAPLERVVLAHIQHLEAADALGRALAGLLPSDTLTCEAGVTIGIHVGVGAAGIAFVCARGD
jgi:DegV family protein with EDD domain